MRGFINFNWEEFQKVMPKTNDVEFSKFRSYIR